MECDRHNFCHFKSFFALIPHYWSQQLKFGKNVKNIYKHMCTINQGHMIYGSWDIKCKRQGFCHFGLFFALWPSKIKILRKQKKWLEML